MLSAASAGGPAPHLSMGDRPQRTVVAVRVVQQHVQDAGVAEQHCRVHPPLLRLELVQLLAALRMTEGLVGWFVGYGRQAGSCLDG